MTFVLYYVGERENLKKDFKFSLVKYFFIIEWGKIFQENNVLIILCYLEDFFLFWFKLMDSIVDSLCFLGIRIITFKVLYFIYFYVYFLNFVQMYIVQLGLYLFYSVIFYQRFLDVMSDGIFQGVCRKSSFLVFIFIQFVLISVQEYDFLLSFRQFLDYSLRNSCFCYSEVVVFF